MGFQQSGSPVAIVGAGAIGLSLASAFARAGHSITVCGGSAPIDRIIVRENDVAESWPVNHISMLSQAEVHHTVVVAVKAHHTGSAGEWIRAVCGPDSRVLVAQNGIEAALRVAPFAGSARVVPSVVYLNVERTAPGCALLRRVGDRDVALPADDDGLALASDLRAGEMRAVTESDLHSVAWSKLLTNITANPLTALTGRRADVMREPDIERLALEIMYEAVAVAQADGASLSQRDAHDAMDWLRNVPPGSTTSMRQDRLAGRSLEHDALTGAVVRAAERHGVDVPVNRLVLSLLSAIEPGEHS